MVSYPMLPYAALKPYDPKSGLDDFVFDFTMRQGAVTRLAPNRITRQYANTYAPVPVALADHAPDEWKTTNPVDLNVSFEVVGPGQSSIDDDLKILRKYMRKDKRTGEPPDLIFAMGRKQWRVRLHRQMVTPLLWTANVDEARARVELTLRTVAPED